MKSHAPRLSSKAPIFALALLALGLMAQAHARADCPADPIAPRYYAALPFRETPYAPLVGVHPMPASEAAVRNHYMFEFDGCGRVVRVRFRLGDTVRDLNDTAGYYHYAPVVEIAYEPGREIRHFFDRHGNPIRVSGDVFTEIFTLDEQGFRASLSFRDAQGAPVANSWGVVRYEWTRHADGVVEEVRLDADGTLMPIRPHFPFYRLHLHYGAEGWLAVMRNVDAAGQPVMNALNAAQDRLEFNAAGDLLSWNVLDADGQRAVGNGPAVAQGIIERDAHGYEIVERYADETGAPMHNSYGYGYTRAAYDAFGNRIERANYSLDGTRLVARETGYAGFRYVYDASGLLRTAIELFDENRAPAARLDQGWARAEYRHDAQGNIVSIRYFDAAGAPMARTDNGVAQIVQTHDARGRMTERQYRDLSGALVADPRTGIARTLHTYSDYGFPDHTAHYDAEGAEVEL